MSRFTKVASIIAVLFVSIAAVMPWPAEAASPSKADKAALKRAIVACKAEAKGKRIKWLSRRKYVNNCVTEAMKSHPNIDVTTMLKDRPDFDGPSSRGMARLLDKQAEARAQQVRLSLIRGSDDSLVSRIRSSQHFATGT
jgi:hypothetical protein